MKSVGIEMHFSVTATPEGARVEETVGFSSFLPVKPLMQRVFRRQHMLSFQRMEQVSKASS